MYFTLFSHEFMNREKVPNSFLPHELQHFSFRMMTKISSTILFYVNEVTSLLQSPLPQFALIEVQVEIRNGGHSVLWEN